ncbi:MAG: hypothetical protein ACLQUY_10990 [Ktedonobacterales bacterium]
MAGNQRQERKRNENKLDRGRVSLAEALGATQQHTVPVLPALDLSSYEQSPGAEASPTREVGQEPVRRNQRPAKAPANDNLPRSRETNASYARATRAHREAPLEKAEPETLVTMVAQPATPKLDREHGQPGPVEPAVTDSAVTDPEITRSMATAQLVLPDVIADSISMEKANQALPAQNTSSATLSAPSGLAVLEQETNAPAIFIRGARKPPRYHYARVVPRRSGSQPLVVQFLVAMTAVMVLFTIFTAVSPLGRSIASLGFVQVYADSIPWVPTATPRPKPTPVPVSNPPAAASLSEQAVINEIVSVFGGYSQGALNVARCESGYDPNAYNPYAVGDSHAEGVFQILYPSTWDTTSYANDSPYDANLNILAAYQIFSRDGDSWREWACQP